VVRLSFSRLYPGLLFPGSSQETGEAAEADSDRVIDSINPLTWSRAADRLINRGVDEVIFMHWMPFFAPVYGRMAHKLRKAGVRTTAIVHNALPHERQPMAGWLTRRFVELCDRVIALSNTVKRDLESIGVEQSIDVRFHPSYDHFGPLIDQAKAREALEIPQDRPVLLFFGLVRHYKGVDELIRAAGLMTESATIVIAGEWYESREQADELIKESGVGDRIHILDRYIPDAEVATLFSAADVVVQPYRSATQSGVVQTAFHFQRPVVVTGVGGLPEMVRHEEEGLVIPPEDTHALAGALDRVLDPELLMTLRSGAAQARERFTWETFVEPFVHEAPSTP